MRVAVIDASLFTIPYDTALCNGLARQGASVHLVGRPLRPEETLPLTRVAFHDFFADRPRLLESMPKHLSAMVKGVTYGLNGLSLPGFLRKLKPHVVHFQWCPLPLIDAPVVSMIGKEFPTVLTVHDTTPFNANPTSRLQQLGASDIFSRFDRLIVHTKKAAATVAGRHAVPAAVIRHGLMPADFMPGDHAPPCAPDDAAADRERSLRFVLLGKLKPYKGADILLRAVALMPEALRRKCRFVIAGKPYMDTAPLVALAEDLGIGDWVDFRFRFLADGEMRRMVGEADVLLFPYREIEASGVLMESLPAGKAIVASRLGSFEELIEPGRHGYLVPPGEPKCLARALCLFAENPQDCRRMGRNVAALAADMPNWDEIALQTLALYDELAGQNRTAIAC